jgi:hypothetical protein
MKFLEIFSKNIFRLLAGRSLKRLREFSIETALARSVRMLDPQTIEEIKVFIKNQQTITGGFADRGGRSDLYYSLFGCYIAEALGIDEVKSLLKRYLKNVIMTEELSGIYLKCALIMYVKLFGNGSLPPALLKTETMADQYSDFINLLAYYYSEDYISLYKIRHKFKKVKSSAELPCSVTAANLILHDSLRKSDDEPWKQMKAYYKNGSFSAFNKTAQGDLLSMGVALYALRFADSELSIIKPDCLTFIDLLYSDGGFCATVSDPDPDVEYTFYGLLALGSLSD